MGGPFNMSGRERKIRWRWSERWASRDIDLTLPWLSYLSEQKRQHASLLPFCYDATDLDLVAYLRGKSDIFLVAALNQDVQTFDNMVAALHFHMYQPVVLANSGEFGGSTAQAPLPKHERLIPAQC
jgi:hypothetical protein